MRRRLARLLTLRCMLATALPQSHVLLLGLLTVLVTVWWLTMRKMF